MVHRFTWQVDTLLMLHERFDGWTLVKRLAFNDIVRLFLLVFTSLNFRAVGAYNLRSET
jgi:hypothetical protein